MTPTHCQRCSTELAPEALACPSCGSLVHGEELKRLAAEAERASSAGELTEARAAWTSTLALLPFDSNQHRLISKRITELSERIARDAPDERRIERSGSLWRRGLPALATAVALSLSKLKFLLLGLTKISTFVSMFAFFGVYWSVYGWPLALGLVVSIYIHEMGHVSMLRTLGINASAPLFIPGVGAMVMLRQHVTDPLTDAKIGLAGPVWGLGAGVAAAGVYAITRQPVWLAIAELTGFLNLFNLIPIWQLDGARGFHALSRQERWMVVAAIAIAIAITGQQLLFIVGAVAVWRAFEQQEGPGDSRVVATYAGLVIALSWLARGVG